jgi:MFS family permease
MGLSYFLLRDKVTVKEGTKQRGESGGWAAYVACFKNRDLMLVSLLMMVGAAGRGGDINQTYLVPHFIRDLGITTAVAATLLTVLNASALGSPLVWGWIGDKFNRKLVLQGCLVASAVTTVWLGEQGALDVLLVINLIIHGAVVNSRQAITQAMVGDYVKRDAQDAAFSIYYTVGLISAPFWTLVMGAIMQELGFAFATKVIALSYIVGMLILIPLRMRNQTPPVSGVAPA